MNALCQNLPATFLQYSCTKKFFCPCAPQIISALRQFYRSYYLISCLKTNLRRDFLLHHFMPIISRYLSETGDMVKTDHSRIACHKFDHRTLFLVEYVHIHNSWENSAQKHKNATLVSLSTCKISRLSQLYFKGSTNSKIAHRVPIQHTFYPSVFRIKNIVFTALLGESPYLS